MKGKLESTKCSDKTYADINTQMLGLTKQTSVELFLQVNTISYVDLDGKIRQVQSLSVFEQQSSCQVKS